MVTRRRILTGLAGAALLRPARADTVYFSRDAKVPPGPIPPSPDVHISYGQSHRSNVFPSFASCCGGTTIDPQAGNLLALHVSNGPGGNGPRPLDNSGILPNVYTKIDGICSYQSLDDITIGRCAVIAEQLLRKNANKTQTPILEFCHAYPGCTWEQCNNPNGAGLAPFPSPLGGSVKGSVAGTPWVCGVTAVNALIGLLARGILSSVNFRSVLDAKSRDPRHAGAKDRGHGGDVRRIRRAPVARVEADPVLHQPSGRDLK